MTVHALLRDLSRLATIVIIKKKSNLERAIGVGTLELNTPNTRHRHCEYNFDKKLIKATDVKTIIIEEDAYPIVILK